MCICVYITCNILGTVIFLLSIYARAYLPFLLPYFTQQFSEKVTEPWQQSGFNSWWSFICMEARLNESAFTSTTTFFQVWVLQRDNWMTKQYFDCKERKPEKEAWGFKKFFKQDSEKLKRVGREENIKYWLLTWGGCFLTTGKQGERKDCECCTAPWPSWDSTLMWLNGIWESTERDFSWCKKKNHLSICYKVSLKKWTLNQDCVCSPGGLGKTVVLKRPCHINSGLRAFLDVWHRRCYFYKLGTEWEEVIGKLVKESF